MDRRTKVELFEQIRREYEHGGGTIRGIAKKLGIHRRMVREAVLRVIPQRPLAAKTMWCLQDAQQHRRADRANRGNPTEPFPGRVFLALRE